jgi:hypothetical protein
MTKLIGIVDLSSGAISDRSEDSLTLDIPADLDRITGVVSLDADEVGCYTTVSGENRVYSARPTVLSRRSPGEECLVASTRIDTGEANYPRSYRIAMVDVD